MWVIHSLRTTVAAGLSLYTAKVLGLSEFYWAPITSIIVMQSTLGLSWDTSKQRIIGTVLGVAFAGIFSNLFSAMMWPFILGILVLGFTCAVLRLTVSAYRFSGVTFAIIMLMHHNEVAWQIGMHRFIEVGLGILVTLIVSVVGPGCPFSDRAFRLLHLK